MSNMDAQTTEQFTEARRLLDWMERAISGKSAQYDRLYSASRQLAMSLRDMYQQHPEIAVTDAVLAAYKAWLTADSGNFGPDA